MGLNSSWVDNKILESEVIREKLVLLAPTSVAAATGTLTRTTFATGSVTLPQLAERVAALLADLKTAGIIK